MARAQGLQHFIEQRAAGPAFAIAAASVIARGAVFWSGGALNIGRLMGPGGVQAFNAVSGTAIGVGSELLASIFGRQWLRYIEEGKEAEGRAGLRRAERLALVAHYKVRARLSFLFMCVGLAASFAAGFSFLHSATGGTDQGSIAGEMLITAVLVAVVSGLGIFYEPKQDDAAELATEHARGLRSTIVDAAGKRIAEGKHTLQDVRLFAKQLPKREQERFLAALMPQSADDPQWSVAEIAGWLGMDTPAGRRQLQRRLAKLAEHGASVTRDDRGRYTLPRSEAFREFADDFVRLNRNGADARTLTAVPSASTPRQSAAPRPQETGVLGDIDTTTTAIGQPA